MKKIVVNIAFLLAATTSLAATVVKLDLLTVSPILNKEMGGGFTNIKVAYQKDEKAVVSATRLNKECMFLLVRGTGSSSEWMIDKFDCQR